MLTGSPHPHIVLAVLGINCKMTGHFWSRELIPGQLHLLFNSHSGEACKSSCGYVHF